MALIILCNDAVDEILMLPEMTVHDHHCEDADGDDCEDYDSDDDHENDFDGIDDIAGRAKEGEGHRRVHQQVGGGAGIGGSHRTHYLRQHHRCQHHHRRHRQHHCHRQNHHRQHHRHHRDGH